MFNNIMFYRWKSKYYVMCREIGSLVEVCNLTVYF